MFGDPKQHKDMMAGLKRAYSSPSTPAHLRPHLAKRLSGGNMAFPGRKTTRMFNPRGGTVRSMATETRDATPASDNMDGDADDRFIRAGKPIPRWARDYDADDPASGSINPPPPGPRGMPRPPRTVAPAQARMERSAKTVTTQRGEAPPIKTVLPSSSSTSQPPLKTRVQGAIGAKPPRVVLPSSTTERQTAPRRTTPANLGRGGKNPLGIAAADRGAMTNANPIQLNQAPRNGNLGRGPAPMPPPTPGPANGSMDWAPSWGSTAIFSGGMGPTANRMGVAPSRGPRGVPARRSQFFGE